MNDVNERDSLNGLRRLTNQLQVFVQRRKDKHSDAKHARFVRAPDRMRSAARMFMLGGAAAVLSGMSTSWNTPEFNADAYTEMVQRLASLNGTVFLVAAVLCFVAAALLKALADLVDQLREPAATVNNQADGTTSN